MAFELRRSSSKGESVVQLVHGVDGRVGLSCSTQLLLWLDEPVAAIEDVAVDDVAESCLSRTGKLI